jgi:hypothetical protein
MIISQLVIYLLFSKKILIVGCSPLPQSQHLDFLSFLLLGSPLASRNNNGGDKKL